MRCRGTGAKCRLFCLSLTRASSPVLGARAACGTRTPALSGHTVACCDERWTGPARPGIVRPLEVVWGAAHDVLSKKKTLALGGLVPQLLQTKGTGPKTKAVDSILSVRRRFAGKIHAFGIGGTATLHLAAILGLDPVDSSGWRNRAARGIIQLPGRGDRLLIQLGNWRGRSLDKKERALLNECKCPGCQEAGIEGLSASGTIGFARRATHNLYVLLEELNEIDNRLINGSYHTWYSTHVFNGMFLRLIDYALKKVNIE